jgi:predicted NAD/FAD-binding protein
MSRPRIAIVGTGIAGLGCAYFLQDRFDLTLFEQADYPGGHTNTIDVSASGPAGAGAGAPTVSFDTGFMVFNRVTYPHLCRLFSELDVPVKPTDMSFSVQHVPQRLEFCGSSLNHLFAQRRNLLRPRFYRMLLAVNRFNSEAVPALEDPQWKGMSLGEYVRVRGYGDDFLNWYLVPMSSAVWSTPPDGMLEFPAMTLIRFFHNHGFLGLHTQHPWWTVDGGAREYVRRLRRLPGLENRIRLNRPVTSVVRLASGGVELRFAGGATEPERFDRVILATHGDQALRLLGEGADPVERRLLSEFRYQPNLATIHSDDAVMPKTRLAWSAWNYRIEGPDADGVVRPQTVYWMNKLQGLRADRNYYVSINAGNTVDRAKIHREIAYEHPLFSVGAARAQAELPGLNRRSPGQAVSFAGSYFRYGFHEDAFVSALECCRAVTGERIWPELPGWG